VSYKLHDYQQSLVDKVRQSYKDGYKAPCVVAPCGAGKSIIISEIARLTTINKKQVLFLVHRRELIDQIKNTFMSHGVNLRYVEFGMVQTVVRKLDKIPLPHLIITDESHHGLAKSYRKIYDYFGESHRLGFTATPTRMDGTGLHAVFDILIHEVDVTWLIENNFLTQFKYFAPKLIDEDALKLSSMNEFTSKSVNESLKNTIWGDVVEHYKKLANDKQAIVYCHSIEASNKVKQIFLEHDIIAEHIDGKTPRATRDEIIQKFRDKEIKILSNVDIIGEGFDVPDCSTVILLRPTESFSLHIQQSMRGMRYKPNKVSIIIDHVGNVMRHGLPDTPKNWRLDAKREKKQPEIKIRQCLKCYAVYNSKLSACSECGYKPEVVQKTNKYQIMGDIELEEITENDKEKIALSLKNVEDCKNMKELHELAKAKGYKQGWAYHQGKRLNLIKN
jgi:superfamily II DNA or RNA helicase